MRKISSFEVEAGNIKYIFVKLYTYIFRLAENTEVMWRNIYSATIFGFPQKSGSITGLGLIGQFLKIDIYGNKLNNQLVGETGPTARIDQLKNTKITLLVFSAMSENALLIQ